MEEIFDRTAISNLAEKPVVSDLDAEAFGNPPQSLQEAFVGVSFEIAYWEAAQFLNRIFSLMFPEGLPQHSRDYRVLDFGCGWGRMLRMLKSHPNFSDAELHGLDTSPEGLEQCRRSLPGVWLQKGGAFPPSLYRDASFDLVYSYSVFSHLSEKCHMAWAQEFGRILKPGGYVCLTTENRAFIDICREYREGKREIKSSWHRDLARSFDDPNAGDLYDQGEFLYQRGSDSYGDAIVPRPFFERKWGWFGFEVVNWFDAPNAPVNGAQNIVTLRKR